MLGRPTLDEGLLAAVAVLVFIVIQLSASEDAPQPELEPATATPTIPSGATATVTATATSGPTSSVSTSAEEPASGEAASPGECDFRDERDRVLGAVVRVLGPVTQGRIPAGTGFHIGGGQYVTAAHVVQDESGDTHTQIWVQSATTGRSEQAEVIAVGAFNPSAMSQQRDLALLRAASIEHSIDYRAPTEDDIARDVRALGYPWSQAQDESADIPPPVVVRGIVSSTAVRDDIRVVQADVQAQSGMSGGPLVDECGVAVAVTSAQPQAREDQFGEGLTVFISMAELEKLR